MSSASIPVGDSAQLVSLFGTRDQHLRKICEVLPVEISHQDGAIQVSGEEKAVGQATAILEQLKNLVGRYGSVNPDLVAATISRVTGNGHGNGAALGASDIDIPGRQVRPRTEGQGEFVKGIRSHDLIFCTGPAGTGKTYLAVAMAVESLRQKRIRKLVMVRPAVEAGESLGFLPGDLQAKINPYLRPLLDALREMMDYEQVKRFMEQDVIEMIPLAYMRGRTLNDAFIILDEAQNTTVSQMKMFLTRMGMNSKVVVSGDPTQVDLPHHTRSGLADALNRLKHIRGYCHVRLTNADIVRHALVQQIVLAYDEQPKRK